MAKRAKTKDHEPIKTLLPRARRAKTRRRRARANVVPAQGVLFNRRGELVIVDRSLARRLDEIVDDDGELIIRSQAAGPIVVNPPPHPPPNAMCGCRGFRVVMVTRLPGRRRAIRH